MHQQFRTRPRDNTVPIIPRLGNALRSNRHPDDETSFSDRPITSHDGNVPLPNHNNGDPPNLIDSVRKLDQIIQNIHSKISGLILASRMKTTSLCTPNGGIRTNKWFQLDTGDFDEFRDDLRLWRTCGSFENRPPPLLIEVYLDLSALKASETLVLVDIHSNKRWDVVGPSQDMPIGSSFKVSSPSQIILERWRIGLEPLSLTNHEDFGITLPTVYKKAIVLIRSIFTFIHIAPCWKLVKQSRAGAVHSALLPQCRILSNKSEISDSLQSPLTEIPGIESNFVREFIFGGLDVPIGRIQASVTYRTECGCNFRVEDAESILSSRFMGIDENFFVPSAPQFSDGDVPDSGGGMDASFGLVGPLPAQRRNPGTTDMQLNRGSVSSFYRGHLESSTISALRTNDPGLGDSSPHILVSARMALNVPHSLPSAFAGRTPFKGGDYNKRTSVSFQAPKTNSIPISSTSNNLEMVLPTSQDFVDRFARLPILAPPIRDRRSLIAIPPEPLHSVSSNCKQKSDQALDISRNTVQSLFEPRHNCNFGRIRDKSVGDGLNKSGGDDGRENSTRYTSYIPDTQPAPVAFTEHPGAESGSLHISEDNIEEFLKLIDNSRILKSFIPSVVGNPSVNRVISPLKKFHLIRESNALLDIPMSPNKAEVQSCLARSIHIRPDNSKKYGRRNGSISNPSFVFGIHNDKHHLPQTIHSQSRFNQRLQPVTSTQGSPAKATQMAAAPLPQNKYLTAAATFLPATSPFGRRRYVSLDVNPGPDIKNEVNFAGIHSGTSPMQSSTQSSSQLSLANIPISSTDDYTDNLDDEPLVFDMSDMDVQVHRFFEVMNSPRSIE